MKKNAYVLEITEEKWEDNVKVVEERTVVVFNKEKDAFVYAMQNVIEKQKERKKEEFDINPWSEGIQVTIYDAANKENENGFREEDENGRDYIGEIEYTISKKKVKGFDETHHKNSTQVFVTEEHCVCESQDHEYKVKVFAEQKEAVQEMKKKVSKIAKEYQYDEEEKENALEELQKYNQITLKTTEDEECYMSIESIEIKK